MKKAPARCQPPSRGAGLRAEAETPFHALVPPAPPRFPRRDWPVLQLQEAKPRPASSRPACGSALASPARPGCPLSARRLREAGEAAREARQGARRRLLRRGTGRRRLGRDAGQPGGRGEAEPGTGPAGQPPLLKGERPRRLRRRELSAPKPMEPLSAVKAKAGAKSAGGGEVAGTGEPQPAPSSSPGSPAPPEPPACKLEDLETLATVGTGTFGRVHLVKEKMAKRYFALKVMSIPDVIRLKQEQHVHNEKSVLKEVNHPFLIRLFWTYHDERFLYMLMEYVPGGELFSYLRNMGRFNNSTGLFYSAEIICAIEYLHSKEIVYRDLKPENILLDKEGHIKLTDFGFAKKLVDRTWTLCGTPEYLAPEVIQSKGHGRAVDWWALGILIFEMLSGFPPFFDDNPFGIYQKILAGKIDFPRHLDLYVKDLIKKLLVVDRTRRLGNMKNGADDVKRHRWFRSIEWEAVPQRKLKPPIMPKVSNDGDTSNFEAYPEDDWNKTPPVAPKDLEIFQNF